MFGKWNWMSLYWLLWVVAGFGVPEAWAIITGRPQDTLSDQVWRIEGHFGWPWKPYHVIMAMILLALFVWLYGHLVDHIWR